MAYKRLFYLLIIFSLMMGVLPVNDAFAAPSKQNPTEQFIIDLMSEMTPEEKVGQLFLVSFQGTDVGKESEIYDFITNHHLGGVVFSASNNNFSDQVLISSTNEMITTLQRHEWNESTPGLIEAAAQPLEDHEYIPLLIGISQEGNLLPTDTIVNELTQLPNPMAIGASWNLDNAQSVGRVMGEELSALGFNLYFVPSLDVLDLTYVEGWDDLGTRTFGGDPYWVGEMGKAYVKGIHQGSGGEMAVIAKHFPGRGSSDRLPEEEVATVRKSLEQLKQIELAPFFAVTGNAPDELSMVDGLLMSHIRYQGFQGNIRATTKPVSFDQAAQEQLMALPEFFDWRSDGGVIVSDNLGSLAVRKFFDPTGESFEPWHIARNAFISGNDLLYFDMYVDAHDLDPYAAIIRVLDSFADKYQEDTSFAQRVDASVYRILKMKYQMYPRFDEEDVFGDETELADVGTQNQLGYVIANQAAVLMSPDPQELPVILPSPPLQNERIVFFTEQKSNLQCVDCIDYRVFSTTALQEAVLRFY